MLIDPLLCANNCHRLKGYIKWNTTLFLLLKGHFKFPRKTDNTQCHGAQPTNSPCIVNRNLN